MMMKGPFRELLAVGPQTIRVCLPTGVKVSTAKLLAAETTPQVVESGSHLTITTSSILDHEVVAIDFKT
jgi:hypothetical protein